VSVCWAKSAPRKARGQLKRVAVEREADSSGGGGGGGNEKAGEETESSEEMGGGGTSEGSELLIM